MSECSLLERVSLCTGGSGSTYLEAAQLKPKDFKGGKLVLNAGAGVSDLETYLRREQGIDCRVVNVDLAYNPNSKFPLPICRVPHRFIPLRSVAGDVKNLPFSDGIFDITFSYWLIGLWVNGEGINRAIGELSRVTRKDIYIYPIPPLYQSDKFGVKTFCEKNFSHSGIQGKALKLSK